MTSVLCLGGTGQFGLPIAQYLAADPVVDRVIVAGRDLVKAQTAAAAVGPKGRALQVGADDEASLPSAREGVSVVVNTLWSAEGRGARVARAAVAAGAQYCDLTWTLWTPNSTPLPGPRASRSSPASARAQACPRSPSGTCSRGSTSPTSS